MKPDGLDEAVAAVAATFNFSPDQLMDMPLDDLTYWCKQAGWVGAQRRGK